MSMTAIERRVQALEQALRQARTRDLQRDLQFRRLQQGLREADAAGGGGGPGGGSGSFWSRVFVLTTTLTARSGAAYGTGTGKLQYAAAGSWADVAPEVDAGLKNVLNKAGASGAYVVGVPLDDGTYAVVAIDDCTHLS